MIFCFGKGVMDGFMMDEELSNSKWLIEVYKKH